MRPVAARIAKIRLLSNPTATRNPPTFIFGLDKGVLDIYPRVDQSNLDPTASRGRIRPIGQRVTWRWWEVSLVEVSHKDPIIVGRLRSTKIGYEQSQRSRRRQW